MALKFCDQRSKLIFDRLKFSSALKKISEKKYEIFKNYNFLVFLKTFVKIMTWTIPIMHIDRVHHGSTMVVEGKFHIIEFHE